MPEISSIKQISLDSIDSEPNSTLEASPRPKLDPVAIGLQVEGISPWRRELSERIVRKIVGGVRFATDHFFWALNGLNGLFFTLAFLAPVTAWWGFGWFYQKVFNACHLLCVQDHNHSFQLFGYQMPFCERCLALYGSMFLGGVAYQLNRAHPAHPFFKVKLRRIPWWAVLLTSLPIAIDGFTQMFGWRESNWELRLLTGTLFGLGLIWNLYPQLSDKLHAVKKIVTNP